MSQVPVQPGSTEVAYSLSNISTILVIEADPSLRRLMALGLQHQGLHVIESPSLEALPATFSSTPAIVVLDIDRGVTSNWSLLEKVQGHPLLTALPCVVLTWDRPLLENASSLSLSKARTAQNTPASVIFLDKPFDARALLQTVKNLLEMKAQQEAAELAEKEAIVLASYSAHAAPSIWPVITAAGLLLVVIGFMLQVLILIAGLALMLIALLIWTIGAQPRSVAVSSRSASATISSSRAI